MRSQISIFQMFSILLLLINDIFQASPRNQSDTDRPFASSSNSYKSIVGYARFFDDDKFDLYSVKDPKDIKVRSKCPNNLSELSC